MTKPKPAKTFLENLKGQWPMTGLIVEAVLAEWSVQKPGGRPLEIGPGHGLMTALALRGFGLETATTLDLAVVSREQMGKALTKRGYPDCELVVQNVANYASQGTKLDKALRSRTSVSAGMLAEPV